MFNRVLRKNHNYFDLMDLAAKNMFFSHIKKCLHYFGKILVYVCL